jgi:hypothetical protein
MFPPLIQSLRCYLGHYCTKPFTVAWRSVLVPARCFTRTISLGWHHLASVSREDSSGKTTQRVVSLTLASRVL